jgi:hypothetical protein
MCKGVIVKKASLRNITKFIIINIIIKFIPLVLIYKDPIEKKDIYATIILVLHRPKRKMRQKNVKLFYPVM